jgi:hypothetical protein
MGIRYMVPPEGEGAGGDGEGSSYIPPATQDDLNRIISVRLERERQRFADYDDLRAAKTELDQIKASQQTEAERAAQALKDAESRANETVTALTAAQAKALRLEIAVEKGISKDDFVLLTASTQEDLEKQADAILKLRKGSAKDDGQGRRDGSPSGGSLDAGRERYERKHGKKQ